MKGWGMVIVAVSALLVPATTAAAKPGYFVEKPHLTAQFRLPGSNGYHVSVGAADRQNGRSGGIGVSVDATRRTQHVDYFAHGTAKPDGSVYAKLPGVGRIAVQFHLTSATHEAPAENCKGRAAVVRHGVFRGAIELHGERGYTTVDAQSASGTVTQSFRQVCDQGSSVKVESPPSQDFSLFTGTRDGPPQLSFDASLINFGNEAVGPLVTFTASSRQKRKGMFVLSSATALGKPAEFSVSEPSASREKATVEPPAPFRGAATFHLLSPTSSTWEGNLEAELPGVGEVSLAGPGYWSALCVEEKCTKTLPANVQIIF
jgi:hypothetical protein